MITFGRICRAFPVLFLLAVLCLTMSCESPVMDGIPDTGLNADGRLIVDMAPSVTDRTASPADYVDSINAYEVFLSGTQAMGPLVVNEPRLELDDLPLGEYSVSATAVDAEGETIAIGSSSGIIVDGIEAAEISLDLLPVMGGEGSLTVRYGWASAGELSSGIDAVIVTLTPDGGSPVEVAAEIGEDGLAFRTDLPTGAYSLACELFSNGQLIASVTETVEIYDGMETSSDLILGTEYFLAAPAAPESAVGRQDGPAVELSWTDASDTETGYRIFRSEDGRSFEIVGAGLPANTTAWRDEPVDPGRVYFYRVVAVNEFGESTAAEFEIDVEPAVRPAVGSLEASADIILGDDGNVIAAGILTEGFVNTLDSSGLDIVAVSLEGGGTARIEDGRVIIDASDIPYEGEGGQIVLEYTVHITGRPVNESYTAVGSITLNLVAPEVEEIAEDDLLPPVIGYVFDDRDEMELKMRLYTPPGPDEILSEWGRISNHNLYPDGDAAEAASESHGDDADLASWWKSKQDGDGSYLEYAKNSVYAGLVCPDGEESENFVLEATVSSKDKDDDVIGLIVASVREGDANYILEAARSHGALSGGISLEPALGWGLQVRRLDGDPPLGEVMWTRQADVGGVDPDGWKGDSVRIRVEREGDTITVSTSDWNDTENLSPGSILSVDLDSTAELRRFRGPRKYGYFVASQERSSFRDIVLEGGVIRDKLFYIDPETGESEVWWYEDYSGRWIRMAGAGIQDVLGYPLEITNPETGETYLVERKGFRFGRWKDWWDRWSRWNSWDRSNQTGWNDRDGDEEGFEEDD